LKEINIAILGMGTVGTGVVKVLKRNESLWVKKCGSRIHIKKILVRNINKDRGFDLSPEVFTTDWQDIVNDPEIKVVIELMGRIEPARTYVLEALKKGKNVVTANKDLLAEYGEELFEAAKKAQKDIYFEASVGGGMPIISPLKESLIANNIQEVMGIVNGTTNFVLTSMSKEGISFNDALKTAQKLGYAEADPTADIEGLDAARKIAILASIAFHTRVKFCDVYVEGISKITNEDIEYAKELGYAIKLIGIGREEDNEVEVRVHPALIPITHPLSIVDGSFNAIFVKGDAIGETMFYGPGAGQMETASAVVGDIIRVIKNINMNSVGNAVCTCYDNKAIKSMDNVYTSYFLRLCVIDRPGVLAGITGVFAERGVSLASVVQKNYMKDTADLVVITHRVREKDIQDSLEIIKKMSTTKEIVSMIRVEGME